MRLDAACPALAPNGKLNTRILLEGARRRPRRPVLASRPGPGSSAFRVAYMNAAAPPSSAYELIPHRRTNTAVGEAEAHADPSQVAKTIVLSTPDGFVRAVLPASERLDLHKVRHFLGTNDVHLGSTVRVRQRASQKASKWPFFLAGERATSAASLTDLSPRPVPSDARSPDSWL